MRFSPPPFFLPFAIFIIALLPRLTFLHLIEFKADEALTLYTLNQTPLSKLQAGLVSSTGARNFPLFFYFIYPLYRLNSDPRFISGAIALLNAMLIPLYFLFLKRRFGQLPALAASLSLAVSPWAILFSRKIWAQDLIPLLSFPLFFTSLSLTHRRPLFTTLFYTLCLLLPQLHGSGFFLLLPLLWLYRPPFRPQLKPAVLGLLLGLLPALPYLHLQLTSQPICPDCRQFSSTLSRFSLTHIYLPLLHPTPLSWGTVLGASAQNLFQVQFPLSVIALLASACILTFTLIGFINTLRSPPHRHLPLLIISLISLYLLFRIPPHLHYYQVLTPWLYLLLGLGAAHLARHQPSLVIISLLLILSLHLLFIFSFYRFLFLNPTQITGDYGVPYHFTSAWVNTSLAPHINRANFNSLWLTANFHLPSTMFYGPPIINLRLAHYFLSQNDAAATPILDSLANDPNFPPTLQPTLQSLLDLASTNKNLLH